MTNVSPFTKEGYVKMNKVIGGKIIVQTIILNAVALAIGIIFMVKQQYAIGAVVFAIMIGFSIAIPLNRRNKINKLVESGKELFDKAVYEYSFGENEYKIHYTCGEETLDREGKYSELLKIIETDKYIYLFITLGVAYIVNKDGFENPEDAKKLVNILKLQNPHFYYKD